MGKKEEMHIETETMVESMRNEAYNRACLREELIEVKQELELIKKVNFHFYMFLRALKLLDCFDESVMGDGINIDMVKRIVAELEADN